MVTAIGPTPATGPQPPLTRLARATAAGTPAPAAARDRFEPTAPPSVKHEVAGIWADEVIGDSQRSYRVQVPRSVPAGFTLDEAALDPRDQAMLARDPSLRPLFTTIDYLRRTDPAARQAFDDLYRSAQNGDLMLRTYGTIERATGAFGLTGTHGDGPGTLNSFAIVATGGAWSHVALVDRPDAQRPPQVIESIFEGGVMQDGLYAFLSPLVDPQYPARRAVSLVRPTDSPVEAGAAVSFAEAQVGRRYNFTMQPNDPNRGSHDAARHGYYCSQLVYQAYDANPAIARPVFDLHQPANEASRSRMTNAWLRALGGEKVLQGRFAHALDGKLGSTGQAARDLGAAWIERGPAGAAREVGRALAVSGQVAWNHLAEKTDAGAARSPQQQWRGRTLPDYVTPGELAPNNGHKVLTILLETQR